MTISAPLAQADDGKGVFLFTLWMFGALVPSMVGLDRAAAIDPDPSLRFGWTYQIPLGFFAPQDDPDSRAESHPLWRHRVVLSATVVYREANAAEQRGLTCVNFDLRAGYRYRFPHWRGIAPYAGLGAGSAMPCGSREGNSLAFFSPEIGLHFGRDRAVFPGMQLGLESEVFAAGSPARIAGVAAWTIF